MLADTVEAAVRSMLEPTPNAIEEFIERLIRGKLEDGQLSDAPITLSDIDKICLAFSTVLNGIFHERIEYPILAPDINGISPRLLTPIESPVEEQELRQVENEFAPSTSNSTQDPMQANELASGSKKSAQLLVEPGVPAEENEPSQPIAAGEQADDR